MDSKRPVDGGPGFTGYLEEVFGTSRECEETYARYRKEAEAAGDLEVASFIGEVINRHRDIAQRARLLISAKRAMGEAEGQASSSP